MKSSYKIAVVSAVVLVIIVFACYLTTEKPTQLATKISGAPSANTGAAGPSTDTTPGTDATNTPRVSIDELAARMRSHYDSVDGVPAPASTPVPAPGTPGTTAAIPDAKSASSRTNTPATQPSPVALAPATQSAATPSAHTGAIASVTPPPHDSGIFDSTPGDHHAPGSAASVPLAPRTYKIATGDTFISIAQKELGSSAHWHAIAEANPLVDPSKLKVGQVIKLPETTAAADNSHAAASRGLSASAITHTHSASLAADGGVTYVVQAGDTLSSIARQYYSNSGLWKMIYNANKETLGGSPNHVREGMKLTIPPLSTAAR